VARRLAVFASLNQVALVKRALHREGVRAEMLRTPRCLAHTGCSFALRCEDSEIALLEEICRKWRIELGGVFADREESRSTLDDALLGE